MRRRTPCAESRVVPRRHPRVPICAHILQIALPTHRSEFKNDIKEKLPHLRTTTHLEYTLWGVESLEDIEEMEKT